jgi:hypothetical protein
MSLDIVLTKYRKLRKNMEELESSPITSPGERDVAFIGS